MLGGIRTLDLIVARWVLYLCATTATHFSETNKDVQCFKLISKVETKFLLRLVFGHVFIASKKQGIAILIRDKSWDQLFAVRFELGCF